MGWNIAIGIGVVIVGYIIYGIRKVKNIKDVPPSNKIRILNNKNFKTIIRKELVLVDFWAPWCAPCKLIAPVLNEMAEESYDKITIAKVNVDQNSSIVQKFNIRNIPTLILFEHGKEKKRFAGVKTKNFLLKECGL